MEDRSWDECQHVWEIVDSDYSNELFTDVKCKRCGVPGQQTNATGEVFWPAT